MKKIVHIFLLICLFTFSSFTIVEKVEASSSTISITGTKTVIVGSTVKLTVEVSSKSNLGSWEFDIQYDSDKLTFVSSTLEGNVHSAGVVSSSSQKTKTYTITFKAKKSGTATVKVANAVVYGFDESKMSNTSGSIQLNIMTQKELEATYSTNNYLKSLSVDGYELTPEFNKDTLDYTLELENDIRSIMVTASKEDSKATVSGTGTYNLTEGENKITVSVTAQNGNTKNYTIRAIVKELNPITVTIDNQEYTVVRKSEELTPPSTFLETTARIEGEEVPAFESSITGYRIIALNDGEGNIAFYKMEEDGTYSKYEEMIFTGITLYGMVPEESDIPKGYEETQEISLGNQVITIYTNSTSYPLIYGMNVETGEKNWYTYDAEEGTIQRFNNTMVEELTNEKDKYLFLIVVLSSASLLIMIFLLIFCAKVAHTKQKKEGL